MTPNLSFKTFITEREKVSGYVSTLDNDLDIDPRAFRDTIHSAANLTINGVTYTGVTFKLLHMNRDAGGNPTKGIIQITKVMGKAFRKDPDGKYVILPNNPPQGPMVLVGKELEALLTHGMNAAPVPGGGAAAPPPGGGPGGM